LNLLFDKQRLQQFAILLIINLSFLFKETFVTIVVSINVLLFALLLKNLLLLIVEFTLKSKNTITSKRIFASFFARVEKLIVNLFLILSFNLVTLDFVNDKKLLKTTITIFLKSFFVLTNLLIVVTNLVQNNVIYSLRRNI